MLLFVWAALKLFNPQLYEKSPVLTVLILLYLEAVIHYNAHHT